MPQGHKRHELAGPPKDKRLPNVPSDQVVASRPAKGKTKPSKRARHKKHKNLMAMPTTKARRMGLERVRRFTGNIDGFTSIS